MGPGSATTATAAPCVTWKEGICVSVSNSFCRNTVETTGQKGGIKHTTGDAVDEDVEDADDARNDGLDHGADGVDNATKAVADA